MQTTTMAAPPVSADYLSAILNWVCPDCGGRMGGRSKEFQCLGQCGRVCGRFGRARPLLGELLLCLSPRTQQLTHTAAPPSDRPSLLAVPASTRPPSPPSAAIAKSRHIHPDGRAHSKEQARHHTGQQQCSHQSADQSRGRQRYTFSQHYHQHVKPLCPKRHTDSHFLRTPAYRMRQHPEQSQESQEQC